MIFFWLNSDDMVAKRVETRVRDGGHNIPESVIRRKYKNGLTNFFDIFAPLVNDWMFIDNSGRPYELIAEHKERSTKIYNHQIWTELKSKYYGKK